MPGALCYRWGNWGLEKGNNIFKGVNIQAICGRTGRIQVSWYLLLFFSSIQFHVLFVILNNSVETWCVFHDVKLILWVGLWKVFRIHCFFLWYWNSMVSIKILSEPSLLKYLFGWNMDFNWNLWLQHYSLAWVNFWNFCIALLLNMLGFLVLAFLHICFLLLSAFLLTFFLLEMTKLKDTLLCLLTKILIFYLYKNILVVKLLY